MKSTLKEKDNAVKDKDDALKIMDDALKSKDVALKSQIALLAQSNLRNLQILGDTSLRRVIEELEKLELIKEKKKYLRDLMKSKFLGERGSISQDYPVRFKVARSSDLDFGVIEELEENE